jgi:hypothetical protein
MDWLFNLADVLGSVLLLFPVFFLSIGWVLVVEIIINKDVFKAAEKTAIISLLASLIFFADMLVFFNSVSGTGILPLISRHDDGIIWLILMFGVVIALAIHLFIAFVIRMIISRKNAEKKISKNKWIISVNLILFLPYIIAFDFLCNRNSKIEMWFMFFCGIFLLVLLFSLHLLILRNPIKALNYCIINLFCVFWFICIYMWTIGERTPIFSPHKIRFGATDEFVVVFFNLIILLTGNTCLYIEKRNSNR